MLTNNLRTALRNFLKYRTTAVLNISGLTLGVAVCLLISVWLQRELSYDQFHPEFNNIFRAYNTFKSESESFTQAPSATGLAAQLPKQMPSITAATRVFRAGPMFKIGDKQFAEQGITADANFFSFFGFRLLSGDPETVLSSANNVVLTEKIAVKYFGSVTGAMGQSIIVDDQPAVVSGIAANCPPNSHIQFDVITPYIALRNYALENYKEDLDNVWVGGWPYTYFKLTDASKQAEVELQMNEIIAKNAEQEWKANKMSYDYFLQPVTDIHLKSNYRYDAANNGSLATVRVFSMVAIMVLLLACANYVNLTTAAGINRVKETFVRKINGASKRQLIGQFFLEALVTCAFSVALGIGIFLFALPFFSNWMGQPYQFPFTVESILLIVTFVVVVAALAGGYPAFMLSSFNPATSLRGNFARSTAGNLVRKGLVIFQFTITIALGACMWVISQQMTFMANKDLGFDSSALIEVNYFGSDSVANTFPTIRNELMKYPFISNVSRHSGNLTDGLGNGWITTLNLKGEEVTSSIYRLSVDEDFFATYDMKLVEGRFFDKAVESDKTKAVLVNEAAVKNFGWGDAANAIGKPFGQGEGQRFVIGVVKDFNFESLHKKVEPLLIGYPRVGSMFTMRTDPAHLSDAINHLETVWQKLGTGLPLEYRFVDSNLAQQYGSEQKMREIFFGFSGLSLIIACMGLFGLSVFTVRNKVKEIGIRKVLGANVPGIVGLLTKDFSILVIVSAVMATPLAWYIMRDWLLNFAFHVGIQWWVFVATGVVALLVALLTVSVQSLKAAMENPTKNLRVE